MDKEFQNILNKNKRESKFSKNMDIRPENMNTELLEKCTDFYQDYIRPSVSRQFEKLIYEESYSDDYMDADEHYISQYIQQIESFINSYGYDKEICSIKDNSSIKEIEDNIRNFLMKEANAWNHLEIIGTLNDFSDREIYVCCYEPYGEELICVEEKNNSLFFFKTPDYKYGIKSHHINYIDNLDGNFANNMLIF